MLTQEKIKIGSDLEILGREIFFDLRRYRPDVLQALIELEKKGNNKFPSDKVIDDLFKKSN